MSTVESTDTVGRYSKTVIPIDPLIGSKILGAFFTVSFWKDTHCVKSRKLSREYFCGYFDLSHNTEFEAKQMLQYSSGFFVQATCYILQVMRYSRPKY